MTNKEKALNAFKERIESAKKTLASCEESMKKDFANFFVYQGVKPEEKRG